MVTGSNDSMVYVWNLNQTGNIYKYLGHRVKFFAYFRTLSPMFSFRHREIKSPVPAKIKLSRSGPTMQKETLLPSRLTVRPFDQLITRMMGSSYSRHRMTRPSESIKLKIRKIYSLWLDTKIGSRKQSSPQTTVWYALEVKTRLSFSGTQKLKNFWINSAIIWAPSTTANSVQTELAWLHVHQTKR